MLRAVSSRTPSGEWRSCSTLPLIMRRPRRCAEAKKASTEATCEETGLLRAIALTRDVSAQVTADLEARGPIVNPVRPDTIRLAPPLVLTTDEVDEFVADLSVVLDGIVASEGGTP